MDVRLGDGSDDDLKRWGQAALDTDGSVAASLALADELGAVLPKPGSGRTASLWSALATVAASDVTTARVVEPHLDALAILEQASSEGLPTPRVRGDERWGVYAAEGKGARLTARETATGWRLDGTKPWCSLASDLTHALVTAWIDADERRMFAVALRDTGVAVRANTWKAHGLTAVSSGPVDFSDVAAVPVGDAGWYLRRPGFAWGGIGVAACWWGGAAGVARTMLDHARQREPDQIGLAHLGVVDVALTAARHALRAAADDIDAGRARGRDGDLLAQRTRIVVARAAATVLDRAAHSLGPAPLALDADHSRRVADLSLYLRQHHDERDEAALGSLLLAHGGRA